MNSLLWSYSGPPDLVSIRFQLTETMEGGFIIFIRLIDDRTWVFASNNPNRCIAKWKNIAKKYDLPAAKTAMISSPVLLYLSVKSKIQERLEPYLYKDTDAYMADMDTIIQETETVIRSALPAILHEY